MMEHKPRKRFGQNFLHDSMVIDRIVRAVSPKKGQRLVEIGPGLGALTLPILQQLGRLQAVELDRDLIPRLEKLCADQGELTIHSADALKFDFSALCAENEKLR
ncbi:MAG: rRNA adenine N-6-methyltransferase family protein, partial [Gammaproteobacteria bacterium]|nr:rRNA adenine N-6-methyltransferase family protein [Gammaproteobacteria bacterium]